MTMQSSTRNTDGSEGMERCTGVLCSSYTCVRQCRIGRREKGRMEERNEGGMEGGREGRKEGVREGRKGVREGWKGSRDCFSLYTDIRITRT